MTGVGIPRTGGKGRTALDDRLIVAAGYSTGVLRGCVIMTSPSNLSYTVSRGNDPSNVAVGSASAADGNVIFPVPNGSSVSTKPGDSALPRIDSIYAVQHNPGAGDTDNDVVLAVVQGVPAPSPSEPAAPAGISVKLASRMVPAGMATTSESTAYGDTRYSIPYGASLGKLGYGSNGGSQIQNWTKGQWWPQAPCTTSYLPTDRLVTVNFVSRASIDGDTPSSFYARLVVDGTPVTDGLDECPVFSVWARQLLQFRTTLSGGRTHDVDVQISPNTNRRQFQWRGLRYVEVMDAGVAA